MKSLIHTIPPGFKLKTKTTNSLNVKGKYKVGSRGYGKFGNYTVVKIVRCDSELRYVLKFNKTGYVTQPIVATNIKVAKDYLSPSIQGWGYLGRPYSSLNDEKNIKLYGRWVDLLMRRRTGKWFIQEDWRNYTVFKEWIEVNARVINGKTFTLTPEGKRNKTLDSGSIFLKGMS